MRYPFTHYRKKSKNGTTIWHARFWDETLQKYAISRSTGILVEGKKEHRREAEEAARKIYDELAEPKPKPTATQSETPAAQTQVEQPASPVVPTLNLHF